jgi:hypothetical protein
MVVVAARGYEQRARIAAHGHFETELADIELLCLGEVGDLEVNVAHPGPRGHRPGGRDLSGELAEDPVDIQRKRGHLQLPVSHAPFVARAIPVDLDPIALGVIEVHGFTNEMVGSSRETPIGFDDATDRARQLGPTGNQDREVEQPGGSIGPGSCPRAMNELDQWAPVESEASLVFRPVQPVEADRFLVELGHPRKIRDAETHGTHMGIGVDRSAHRAGVRNR